MNKVLTVLDEYADHITIEAFNEIGIKKPTKKQLKILSTFTQKFLIAVEHQLIFSKKLSKKEISCLFLAAQGKTSQEIAQLLNVEISTIKTHRKRIQMKLACKNITQAVFEGIRLGYIPPRTISHLNTSFEGHTQK